MSKKGLKVIFGFFLLKMMRKSSQGKLKVSKKPQENKAIKGKITEITFLGQFVRYLVLLNNNQEIQVRSHDEVSNINVNDDVMLSWRLEDFLVHEG